MTPASMAALHARAMTIPAPYSEADFLSLLAVPGVFVTGDARGFAVGRVAADEAELLTLCTAPEARRQGLGRARLAEFETEALRRGAATAFLEVAESNLAARALYAGAGWREVGRRRLYYTAPGGERVDGLVMSKALAG